MNVTRAPWAGPWQMCPVHASGLRAAPPAGRELRLEAGERLAPDQRCRELLAGEHPPVQHLVDRLAQGLHLPRCHPEVPLPHRLLPGPGARHERQVGTHLRRTMEVERAPDGPCLDDRAGVEGLGDSPRLGPALAGRDRKLGRRGHLGLHARQPFHDLLHRRRAAGRQALPPEAPGEHLVVGHLHRVAGRLTPAPAAGSGSAGTSPPCAPGPHGGARWAPSRAARGPR